MESYVERNAHLIEELEYDKFNKITKCLMYDGKSKKRTKYSLGEITIRLGNMQLAGELIRMINLNKYDGKVLKYVAPYFNLTIDSSDPESEESKDD